jgi:2-polyprenyl-3-methyl-5-hydroxy-6-metoxy-1,4-benzoquinol methylase
VTIPVALGDAGLETRARQSLGSSEQAIYRMVADAIDAHGLGGGRLVDVGCGGGALWQELSGRFSSYCGLDAVRYSAFPADADFRAVDLDGAVWPIDPESADLVVAVETIEHLENPWAFLRQLASIARPGGGVMVTTPNQLSVLSLLTLGTKGRFSAFQDVHYPAHRTALLASDLERAARAAGLVVACTAFSRSGRLPLTPWHYPAALSAVFPRALSDNLMIVAGKPA